MISRYVKHIEIEDGVFAVFHSLLCKPPYVDGDELQRILNDEIESFNEEEQTALYERGIFLRDATLDARAYELLVDARNKRLNVAPVLYLIPTSGCNLGRSNNKLRSTSILRITRKKTRLGKIIIPRRRNFCCALTINCNAAESSKAASNVESNRSATARFVSPTAPRSAAVNS